MGLLHLLLLAWLSWLVYRKFSRSPVRLYYFPALVVKIAAGIAMGMLYFIHYDGGDTINYHQDATALSGLALEDPHLYLKVLGGKDPESIALHYASGQERAFLTVKIFSLFYLLTYNSYWISACYISFLAFLSLFWLVHRIVDYRPENQKAATLAFLFWPSFTFWTSGLLKESLAIICIAFIVSTFIPCIMAGEKLRWPEILVAALLMVLLFNLKYYYAGILGPVLGCLVLSLWLGRKFDLKQHWVRLGFMLLLTGGILVATQLHPNMYISRFLGVLIDNYYILSAKSAEGAYVQYEQLEPVWTSVLRNAPKAVIAGLFAPLHPADWTNPLRLAASAENILLLLLSIAGIAGWILKEKGRLSLPVFAVIIYVLAFALILGIAAPNYGTLSRYRVCYQPFFVLLILSGCQNGLSWFRQKREAGKSIAE